MTHSKQNTESYLENLKDSFVIPDNYPRNHQLESEALMTEKFSLFLRTLSPEQMLDLLAITVSKKPLVYLSYDNYDNYDERFDCEGRSFEVIHKCFELEKDNFLKVKPRKYSLKEKVFGEYTSEYKWENRLKTTHIGRLFGKISLYDLVCHCHKENADKKISDFFSDYNTPYNSKRLNSLSLENKVFSDCGGSISEELNTSSYSIENVHQLLYDFVDKHDRNLVLNDAFQNEYNDWLKFVYNFKDNCGNTIMQVIKLYPGNSNKKILLPLTCWGKARSSKSIKSVLPLKKKQILYNLDLLEQNPEIVILTDSIEIADLNQSKAPNGVVWTSFLCEPGKYDQIDWSPLKKFSEIFFLLTNHSGKTLVDSYKQYERLLFYLKDNEKISSSFKCIQLEVEYGNNSAQRYLSISDVINDRKNCQPQVIADSLKIMDFAEYEDMLSRAKDFCPTPMLRFWGNPYEEAIIETVEDDSVDDIIPYIGRPILARGHWSMFHAPTKHGKSSLLLSFCAAYVANTAPILGSSWNFIKSDYDYNKVLYLDLESGGSLIKRRKKLFVYPYFPKDKDKKTKCDNNFIIEDMKKHTGVNFSLPENHPKILKMVEDAKGKGIEGQPVDLVVIDTYSAFIDGENVASWKRVEPLVNKIIEQNIAVLIIAHSKNDGTLEGFEKKKHSCSVEVKLFNEKAAKEAKKFKKEGTDEEVIFSLNNPLKIKLTTPRICECAHEQKFFYVRRNPKSGKWELTTQDNKSFTKDELEERRLEDFGGTVKGYMENGTTVESIATMMGYGSSQFHKLRNDYNAKFPDKKIPKKKVKK